MLTSVGAASRVGVVAALCMVVAGAAGWARAGEATAQPPKSVKVAAISLVWDEGQRTLVNALRALDEAGAAGADIACLPEECVYQAAETIPGPAADAIAGRAAQHKMYVVGNLREKDGGKTYVTSFLCDRQGRIVGKYRKSHRLPYEEGLTLGDELPVFATDLGVIGMKIGTDHFFPEIDTVLRRRGASLVVWSAAPFPLRDEHMETLALQGRAVDNNLSYAVARYAGRKDYGGYRDTFSWMATWPLGRAQVLDNDGHTRADSGHAGGLALATLPAQAATRKWTNEEGFRRPDAKLANGAGYPATGVYAAIAAEKPPAPFERKPGAKRTIKVAAIESEGNIDRLIAKLDACGRLGCDIVCLWEYVWYNNDAEVEKFRDRNRQYLARIADSAKRHAMYVVIAGELERGFNEAILYSREGNELGRYTKINQTTDKKSKYYQAGDRVGIFDLDFGRICVKICADVYTPEIDRVAALHQADLMLVPTQDAGPFTEHTRLRDAHRCLDDGYFLLRAACATAQTDHRTYIMDPWGVMLAASQYQTNNEPVVATLQLDNRPKYHEWPEEVRKAGPYPDPYKRGLDEKALSNMYTARPQPVAKGDLRAVLLAQRRPELYRARE
ncbi:MAG: carbon-nitrogen hydrolase family protein [Planctomycetota bacterium]|nr:carbon-nitrogen hydrolase family protein [Planctomycetota bacterium]